MKSTTDTIKLAKLLKYLEEARKVVIEDVYGNWIGYEDLIKFLYNNCK